MNREIETALVESMVILINSRDRITGTHVLKSRQYVKILVEEMRNYTPLTEEKVQNIVYAAPLHDIGKIDIPDSVLKKKEKYDDKDYSCMKKHTIIGSQILESTINIFLDRFGYTPEILEEGKVLAEFHHEKWDGSGYPHGLKGEEIPLSARIMAVADVFDAYTARRLDSEPLDFSKSVAYIENGAGNHFDPQIVKTFLEVKDKIYYELKNNK